MQAPNNQSPIGVFDSGVGGLSVLRAIPPLLPSENIIYLADQAHVPYGARSKPEILAFSRGIVRYFLDQGVKLIVLACNTASAAALHTLRVDYPDFPFVGMEPAVKPAAQHSKTNVVGVLATPSTFEGELFASLVDRFAKNTTLLQDTCPGLVQEIEAGRANGEAARAILARALAPMMAQGVDRLVLGCTHYPFAADTIRELVGPEAELLDPAPAIAQRVKSLLGEGKLENPSEDQGWIRFITSGDREDMQARVLELLGVEAEIESLEWEDDELSQPD